MTYYPCSTCGYEGSHRCYYGGYDFGCGRNSCECTCDDRHKRYWAEIERLRNREATLLIIVEDRTNQVNEKILENKKLLDEKTRISEIEALKRAIERLEVTP